MNSVAFGIVLGLGIIGIIMVRGYLDYINHRVPLPIVLFRLTRSHRILLERYFRFYREFSPEVRKEFDRKLVRFIRSKIFIPRNMKSVTTEMKVCISATAIQLTLGLPDIYLSHFKYILIYPDQYFSTNTRKYHQGEVNPGHQAIVLSWKSYVEGYAYEEGVNLGLHEMAHALHLENMIRNDEYDFLPIEALKDWDGESKKEVAKINSGSGSFFRNYGGSDRFEFFAVAIENFFERPDEFKAYNTVLYLTLCKVLNQDPLEQK